MNWIHYKVLHREFLMKDRYIGPGQKVKECRKCGMVKYWEWGMNKFDPVLRWRYYLTARSFDDLVNY